MFVPATDPKCRAHILAQSKRGWDAMHAISHSPVAGRSGATFLDNILVPRNQFSMEVLGRFNEASDFESFTEDLITDIDVYGRMPASTLICETFNNKGRAIAQGS